MAKEGIHILILFSMFFLALPNNLTVMPGKLSPPCPLCATQYALLNSACATVPLVPLPPPPPESGRRAGHWHGHRHGHRQSHGHHGTPEQRNCCRWLKVVDIECVCDILVHLPAFLSRLNHNYTVVLGETCSFTYSCGGRLKL